MAAGSDEHSTEAAAAAAMPPRPIPIPNSAPPNTDTIPSLTPEDGSGGSIVIESSEQDDRIYGTYTLQNGMECLLVCDPTTDKASAALDVRVGHLSDPDNVSGLAHFLEHMLFMGTEKYPDENSYNVYLNAHGGSSNAFTDMESTNYYFDVAAEQFAGALDRFAQFFIAPLFTPSATDREMNAVDSEHAKNLQSDFWRMFQLSKSLCKPSHPFSKFGSGNLETLKEKPIEDGLDIRKELLAFHEQYYSANVMKLVVLGRESIDELQKLVMTSFSDVPNKNLSVPKFPGTPFGPEQLAKRLNVVPVREMRSLEMNFPMREIDTLYLQKPTRYISHLIGHEGEGSVLSFLKDKGWANELSAGESRTCSDWSAFTVSIELTDAGLEHVNDVVEVVFAYIALLKREGPQQWIHEETSTVAACSFRFLSKRNPIDYTCSLAGAMQIYPAQHTISGPYKIYTYDPESIKECMSYFTPSNMILAIVAKTFEGKTNLKEYWYQTEYSLENIPTELQVRWNNATVDSDFIGNKLHFPERNDMIASDFTLREVEGAPTDEPRLLIDTKTCRLWYKPDNVFNMPKVNAMAQICTATAYESPEASVLSFLWVQILQEHCNEFTYLASMAGLHCSFVNARHGIEVNVSGYNHKANVLMGRIINAMVALPDKLESDLFERIKDKASKQYQNFLFSPPYQHAFYGADLCLETEKWTIEDKISALADTSITDVIHFSRRLLSRFHLELLVHGNCSPEEARTITSTVLDGLIPLTPFQSSLPRGVRVVQLSDQTEYVHRFPEFNEGETNSSIENVYQIGPMDLTSNAILAFLHHLIKEPAFNELRTEEQLGYIVHTSIKTSGDDIKGLLFLIQSDTFDPVHLNERIEAFLERFRSKIVDMSEEKFRVNIDAVVKNFLEKNKNLGEESTKYWNVILNGSYLFKKFQLLGEEVSKLSKNQVLIFFDKYVAKDAPKRKKLSVQVFAKNHLDRIDDAVPEGTTIIKPEDVVEFKRIMPLFPLAKSVDVSGMKME